MLIKSKRKNFNIVEFQTVNDIILYCITNGLLNNFKSLNNEIELKLLFLLNNNKIIYVEYTGLSDKNNYIENSITDKYNKNVETKKTNMLNK